MLNHLAIDLNVLFNLSVDPDLLIGQFQQLDWVKQHLLFLHILSLDFKFSHCTTIKIIIIRRHLL